MFSASESTHATTARARSMPASSIVSSSEPRPSTSSTSFSSAYSRTSGLSSITTNGTSRRAQVLRDLPADAAEPADQVVVLELGDLALHAAFVEQSREVAGDEQLRQGDEDEEHRTHAEDRQDDLGDLAAQGVRVRGSIRSWRPCRAPTWRRSSRRHPRNRPAPRRRPARARRPSRPAARSGAGRTPSRGARQRGRAAARRASGSARRFEWLASASPGLADRTRRLPGSVMVRLAGQDLVRAKQLLEQDHPRELVRERDGSERQACCRRAPARPRSSPNGPPTTNARSARDMRRSAISSASASLDSAFPSRSSAQTWAPPGTRRRIAWSSPSPSSTCSRRAWRPSSRA